MGKSARDIFVISDLHLGDGGARDNFEAGKKTPQLRAFLDHVGSEGGELFVLGDLFELWQMNLSVLFVKRRALLDHFAALNLIYVPGNHDVDLAHFIGTDFLAHPFFGRMRAPFIRELGANDSASSTGTRPILQLRGRARVRPHALHLRWHLRGRERLSVPRERRDVEDVLEQFGESMLTIWQCAVATMKHRMPNVADKEVRPRAALTPVQNPDRLGEHVVGVRADLEKGAYDVAVLGHTHKPGRIGDWYFNSGSWTGPVNSFLRISPDGHVRHLEWKDGRAIERAMPLVLPDAKPDRVPAVAKNPFGAAISAARTFFPKPAKLERSRWVLLIQGALALSLGVFALMIAVGQGSSAAWRLLASAFGAYALLDGVMSLVGASREQPIKRLLSWVRGVAGLLLGLVVLRRSYAAEIFVVFVGVWAFIAGALRVSASVVFQRIVDSEVAPVRGHRLDARRPRSAPLPDVGGVAQIRVVRIPLLLWRGADPGRRLRSTIVGDRQCRAPERIPTSHGRSVRASGEASVARWSNVARRTGSRRLF